MNFRSNYATCTFFHNPLPEKELYVLMFWGMARPWSAQEFLLHIAVLGPGWGLLDEDLGSKSMNFRSKHTKFACVVVLSFTFVSACVGRTNHMSSLQQPCPHWVSVEQHFGFSHRRWEGWVGNKKYCQSSVEHTKPT